MRKYILTQHERKLIKKFLENGTKPEGFRVLLHRARRNIKRIKNDLMLLSKMLRKIK